MVAEHSAPSARTAMRGQRFFFRNRRSRAPNANASPFGGRIASKGDDLSLIIHAGRADGTENTFCGHRHHP